ncbi:MAG: hypothetical protein Q9168_005936 [Polycauliona sp. 1 TL-2023]
MTFITCKVLAALLLLPFTRVGCIDNANATTTNSASVLALNGAQQVMKLLGFDGTDQGEAHDTFMRESIRAELQQRLSSNARLLLPGDQDFHIIDERYTNYRRPTFIAGVQVAEERDVVETVNYARSRGVPFMARTGGHSLTISPQRVQSGIVIDMRGLNAVKYDVFKQQMTVGGGITTGEFANATFSRGMEVSELPLKAPKTRKMLNVCQLLVPALAQASWAYHLAQGKYGYLNDNMVSLRLLLANGTIVTVSEEENSDIFWAVRGAGHNFGIGLEATFQVYPQENDGKHYVVDLEYELDQLESLFGLINEISSPMPKELALFIIGRKRGATGGPTLNLNMVYSGPESDAQPLVSRFQALEPVWRNEKVAGWDALPVGAFAVCDGVTSLTGSRQWSTYNGLNNILCTPEGWARFPIKNFYAANVKSYDIPTMRTFFDDWKRMNAEYDGHAQVTAMFESFPQQGVRAKNNDATAYPWREGSDHFLLLEVGAKDHSNEEIYDEFLSKNQDAWIKTSGYGRLQQYVNYGHGSKDPPEALYGYEPWRLERLRALKRQLDPEGLFNAYQPFVEGLSA